MSTDYRLVLCTCPDRTVADHLATMAVSRQLAACVNIVPGLQAVYSWQGQIESSEECLLLIKTRQACLAALQDALVSHHPYQVPEVISLVIEDGYPPYLAWLGDATRPSASVPSPSS
jgi:periplasmic divalent cation tolerance protein